MGRILGVIAFKASLFAFTVGTRSAGSCRLSHTRDDRRFAFIINTLLQRVFCARRWPKTVSISTVSTPCRKPLKRLGTSSPRSYTPLKQGV